MREKRTEDGNQEGERGNNVKDDFAELSLVPCFVSGWPHFGK